MADRYWVEEAELSPELRERHAELMSSPMSQWPADLKGFVTSLPVDCGQALADRVGAWLYGGHAEAGCPREPDDADAGTPFCPDHRVDYVRPT